MTDTPAWTAGPWEWWDDGTSLVRVTEASEQQLICKTILPSNARLIAAAPGLYDMLTIAARTIEIINETLAEHGLGPSEHAQEVVKCSRQILAKARGNQ